MRLITLIFLVVGLTACSSTSNTEMPTNAGNGADQMRPSPCACQELDYDGRGFKWVG